MAPPAHLRGRAVKRSAEAAARRWRQMRFADLLRDARTTEGCQLNLPVFSSSPSTALGDITVNLHTNHALLQTWWELEHYGFIQLHPAPSTAAEGTAPPLVTTEVHVHVGPPTHEGYPHALEVETANWTEGVLRGEAYAYRHHGQRPPAGPSSFLSPVRWLNQPLLDGFVSRRLDAHRGVTSAAMLHTREMAQRLGRLLPPHEVSPYYSADELLHRWLVFGEEAQLVPTGDEERGAPTMTPCDAADHLRRVLQIALGGVLLPSLQGVWLSGAVLTHRQTGEAVYLLGPRQSGRTTLALHCLNALGPDVMLTASEDFILSTAPDSATASGPAAPSFLHVSIPCAVPVGLGAVLGTLRPNEPVAAHVRSPLLASPEHITQLLRNSDGVLWHMAHKHRVLIPEVEFPGTSQGNCWRPAVVGRAKGIVLLGWSVEELYTTAAAESRTRVTTGTLLEHWGYLEQLASRNALLRGHHLLHSAYSETAAWERLVEMWKATAATTAVAHISGSVNFNVAVDAVRKLLA